MFSRSILKTLFCYLVSCSLTSCYLLDDPIYREETALAPSTLWQPRQFYDPCPCVNQPNEEELTAFLQSPDIVVADLIDVALQNNPKTQYTWAQARAAAFGAKVAQSALYPNIEWQESLNYTNSQLDHDLAAFFPIVNRAQNSSNTCSYGTDTWLVTDLFLSYLLFDLGGRHASIVAAKQALYASNWAHNRQIQEVIFSVLESYYIYASLQALLEAREIDLKNAQTNLAAAEQQFEIGAKTKLDVLQAHTDLINIQLNIVELEGQKSIAFGNLANAMGLPANLSFYVPEIPHHIHLDKINADIDSLVALAKNQRPDIAAAYAEHEKLKANVVVARSAGQPNVTLNLDWQEIHYFQHSCFNNHTLSATVALNVPLFNGLLYYNQTRQAQELLRSACANLHLTKTNAAFEVVSAYYDYKTAVESFTYNENYLNYSEEAYQAALLSYQEGIGDILDLLAAQRTLINARAQKIQSLTRWAIALAKMALATGGLGTV